MTIRPDCSPRRLWVGLTWIVLPRPALREGPGGPEQRHECHLWLLPVPCLGLHLVWSRWRPAPPVRPPLALQAGAARVSPAPPGLWARWLARWRRPAG